MNVTILTPKEVLFEGEASSVFAPGDLAEFELLDHHAPLISLLAPGNVMIDGKTPIPVKKGMIKFDQNACMILVEE